MRLVGIDEVGRGSWAGPVVAAAVLLDVCIPGVRDSKCIAARERAQLSRAIEQHAAAIGIGWVTAKEIDDNGLTTAIRLAMIRAMSRIHVPYDGIIIDGPYNFLPEYPQVTTIIRADQTVPAVSAASIIAKVARDTFMKDQAITFPAYAFDTNVGYGTKAHRQALETHGICALHRKRYKPIAALIAEQSTQ